MITYIFPMKLIINRVIYILLAAVFITACKTPIDPDFTFSPEMPKAGERVTFTNLTEEGEHWNWTYGDGGKSTTKNPTYIYRMPGVYDVTLMVDSNKNYVRTKKITIYDTIPSIYIDRETVKYYESCTFNALVYNPYSYTVSYKWSFSANAISADITAGESTKSSLSAYFTKRNVEETVNLEVSIGDSIYFISKTFFVEDVPARSMLIAQKDGKILRQRMFENGLEEYTETTINAGKHPFYIQALSNSLYVFDAGTHVSAVRTDLEGKAGDGNIRKIDLATETGIEIINNNMPNGATHGFYNGFVDGTDIYWTDFSEFIYKTPNDNSVLGAFDWQGNADAQTSVPYYMVKTDRLGYYGNGLGNNQLSAGIYSYDNVFFWAKGGSGKGIYRFTGSDILSQNVLGSGTPPQAGSILQKFSIRAFEIDHVNQKIYFSATAPADSVGLWVANISGSGAVRIDNAPMENPVEYITGIVVDHVSNRVYWAYRAPAGLQEAYFETNPTHRTGIKYVRLAKNISVDKNIGYFTTGVAAYGITIDEVQK
jgi:PKD repeat protein